VHFAQTEDIWLKSASEGKSGISLIEEGCKEASHLTKKADQKEATEKLVRMISDEALIIPLWKEPVGIMHQNYVHTMFNLRGFIHWASYDDWMEKH
jgi:hypothetical protein